MNIDQKLEVKLELIERELPDFRKNISQGIVDFDQIKRMGSGWVNDFAAFHPYCEAMLQQIVRRKPKMVLECGSGFTTILLTAAALELNFSLTVLEHSARWVKPVREALGLLKLPTTPIIDAPLMSYGQFDWYSTANVLFKKKIEFIVCDGPPGLLPGGRRGVIPVLQSALAPDCTIILDDAERPPEQETLAFWQKNFGTTHELIGGKHQFALVSLKRDSPR